MFSSRRRNFNKVVASGADAIEVDTDRSTDRLAVADRVLNRFVGKAEALLGKVYTQHAPPSGGSSRIALDVILYIVFI
jgi:hypothetical protein